MVTSLSLVEVFALPTILAGIGLIISVTERLGANWHDAALLAVAVMFMAIGLTGLYTLT